MTFYVTAIFDKPLDSAPPISCIYLNIDDKVVCATWDESLQERDPELPNTYNYRLRGICLDDDYAIGYFDDKTPVISVNEVCFDEDPVWDSFSQDNLPVLTEFHVEIIDIQKLIPLPVYSERQNQTQLL